METTSPLRVGLIGCGIISDAHIRAYQHHASRARITTFCDVDLARAQDKASPTSARATDRFEEVIADPDIDAVDICTPHQFHMDQVIAAARAGKHILCQKPLARTLQECDAMIAAAREAGVVLFYGEMHQTWPSALVAKQAIADGRIGRIVGLQATYAQWQGGKYMHTPWRYNPEIAGGGALADGGIHHINLLLNIGGPVEAVSCTTTRFREELGGEDTSVVNLRYAAGHLGQLFSSHAVGGWPPYPGFVAFGTQGILTIGDPWNQVTLHRRDLPDKKQILPVPEGDSFAAMVGSYLNTVLDGAPSASSPEVGRENLRVVLAAYESARLRREVRVADLS